MGEVNTYKPNSNSRYLLQFSIVIQENNAFT